MIESGIISGMLSLPSNMFYNVTLPATLWFFDRGRANDPHILFIDARNVFHQIDRAHREFTEEQIHNLACIRHLYQGDRGYYDRLLTDYEQKIADAKSRFDEAEERLNSCQQEADAMEKVSPIKKRELRVAEADYNEAKAAYEYITSQRNWLVERFPEGEYVDVTGLCKAASMEEIREQDYSLNPGRYVGVVIEDDGLTEEEFRKEMLSRNEELNVLSKQADELMGKINEELKGVLG